MPKVYTQQFAIVKAWFDAGYNLIPLCRGTKEPYVRWKEFQTERIPVDLLCQWGRRFVEPNWAVLLGPKPYSPAPPIVAIDCDDHDAEKWLRSNVPLTTMAQRTGSGIGTHFLYRMGEDTKSQNLRPSFAGEIRATGNYILLPFSRNQKGSYTPLTGDWLDPRRAVATLPVFDRAWFAGVKPPPSPRKTLRTDAAEDEEPDWLPALGIRIRRARAYLEKVPGTVSGENGSGKCFCTAMKIVERFAIPEAEAIELLTEWGERADQRDGCGHHYPWSEREIVHKVRDALRKIDPDNLGIAYEDWIVKRTQEERVWREGERLNNGELW